MSLHVVAIPQAGGGTRYVAMDYDDYRVVQSRPAMIDHITALACLDVAADGSVWWMQPFGGQDTPEGREAIRAYRARH